MMVQIVCPYCSFSKSVPEEKIPPGARTAICPRCKERFEILPARAEAKREGSPGGRRLPPPWERRSEVGVGAALRGTVKGVLFSPGRFFRNSSVRGGLREPLAFGMLAGSLGVMFEIFWQGLLMLGDLPSLHDGPFGQFTWVALFLVILVLCPVLATLFICVTSLVLHLLLAVVGGGRNGFEATFRAVSYSQATQMWAVVPFVGSLLAAVWVMVVQVISLREIHAVSYAKLILALLIPFIILVMTIAAVLAPFLLSV